MKIKSIIGKKFDIELAEPFSYFHVTLKSLPYLFLVVEIDNNISGHGEAALAWDITGETQDGALEILEMMKLHLVGMNIDKVKDIKNIMLELNEFFYNNSALKCGIEMSLFDALGKFKNEPVWKLLNGNDNKTIKSPKVLTYEEQENGKMKEIITNSKAKGADIFKLKAGHGKIVEVVDKIVQIDPDTKIILDVNQGWKNREKTMKFISKLHDYKNIFWIEQPVLYNDYDGLARIKKEY